MAPHTNKEIGMYELTTHDLDAQLAEQLPARELMGRSGSRGSTTIIQGNSDNFNQSCQVGLFNVNNVGNGDFNFNLA
jgi:hypothetical protein